MTDFPLTDDQFAEIGTRAAHLHEFVTLPAEADHLAGTDVPALLVEIRRLQQERNLLIDRLAKTEPAEPYHRLEDGSTHAVQALTEAGEACVQQDCTAAREESRLRQEEYSLRAAVDSVLDEVGHMAADGQIAERAAGELRGLLRQALSLRAGVES